jgi:hypothetical protein
MHVRPPQPRVQRPACADNPFKLLGFMLSFSLFMCVLWILWAKYACSSMPQTCAEMLEAFRNGSIPRSTTLSHRSAQWQVC